MLTPSPAQFFVVAASLFGVMMAFVTPPFDVPDEVSHYYRSYQLSCGRLVSQKPAPEAAGLPSDAVPFNATRNNRFATGTGDFLPAAVVEFGGAYTVKPTTHTTNPLAYYTDRITRYRIEQNPELQFVAFNNAAVHSPVPYLPQALSIRAGRQVTDSAIVLLWIGRLANLLCYIVAMYFAIRITPLFKWVFVLQALTPKALSLAASLSSDTVTNGVCFLFIAQILRLAFGPEEMLTRRRLLALLATIVLMGLSKQMYYPLLLSYWLIPAERIGSRRAQWCTFGVMVFLLVAVVGSWSAVVAHVYSPARENVSPPQQLRTLLTNPALVLAVVNNTCDQTFAMASGYVGRFGWDNVSLPAVLVFLHCAVLLVVASGDRPVNVPPLSRWARLVALTTTAACIAVMGLTIYLTWSQIGEKQVTLLGRYFIPFGPMALLPLCGFFGASAHNPPSQLPRFVQSYSPLLLAAAMVTIVRKYYL